MAVYLFTVSRTVDLAEHGLQPVLLINSADPGLQSGDLVNLLRRQPHCRPCQFPVSCLRKTQDDFCIGIAYYRNIQQPGGLVRNDKSFPIRTHFRNGIGDHLHRFSQEVRPVFRLHCGRPAQQIVRLLQNGYMLQRQIHGLRLHTVLLQTYYQHSHDHGLCFRRAYPAQIHDHILFKQFFVRKIGARKNIPVNPVAEGL